MKIQKLRNVHYRWLDILQKLFTYATSNKIPENKNQTEVQRSTLRNCPRDSRLPMHTKQRTQQTSR